MKIRRLLAIAAILAGYLLFVSCGKKTPSLNLLVWEGYADPSFVRGFEDQYRCKISASYMGSSDELVAKLRGGSAGNYDVISPSSDVATSIAAARSTWETWAYWRPTIRIMSAPRPPRRALHRLKCRRRCRSR